MRISYARGRPESGPKRGQRQSQKNKGDFGQRQCAVCRVSSNSRRNSSWNWNGSWAVLAVRIWFGWDPCLSVENESLKNPKKRFPAKIAASSSSIVNVRSHEPSQEAFKIEIPRRCIVTIAPWLNIVPFWYSQRLPTRKAFPSQFQISHLLSIAIWCRFCSMMMK